MSEIQSRRILCPFGQVQVWVILRLVFDYKEIMVRRGGGEPTCKYRLKDPAIPCHFV